MVLQRDEWLSYTEYVCPGLKAGLPLPQERQRANEGACRIDGLQGAALAD